MKKLLFLLTALFCLVFCSITNARAQGLSIYSSSGFVNPGNIIDVDNSSYAYLNKSTTGQIVLQLDSESYIEKLTVKVTEGYADLAEFFVSADNVSYSKIGEVDDDFGMFSFSINASIKYIKILGDCSSDDDLLEIAEILCTNTIKFSYDGAGNRTARYTFALKSGSGQSLINGNGGISPGGIGLEGLEDFIGGKNLTIYPNPTRGELLLEFKELPEEGQPTFELFDSEGRLLKGGPIGGMYHLLDLNSQPNGNYLLQIQLGKFAKTYQIIKQ